ncbi:MAG TPA: carboxylesterase family protein, partial [Clostridia bacterium]|nr:carboxylesterase family protein [Clostridia bacterium]
RSVMTDNGALYTTLPIADGVVLPGTVQEVFESGNYNHVPIIIGSNWDEQRVFVPSYLATVPTSSGHTWYNAFNVLGFYSPSLTIDEFMPPDGPDRELYDTVGRYSSLYWKAGAVDSIARILKKQQKEVYCYNLKWGGKGSGPSPYDFLIGSGHTTDLSFFFGWDYDCFGNAALTKDNEKGRKALQKDIMSYTASFASSGNPNKAGSGLPVWKAWSNNAGEPKSIVFDADYEHAKICMMNEEYTKEDVLNQINALPSNVRDMIKVFLWV